MNWQQVRQKFPHKWLVVEALKAHSEANKRIVEQLTVVNSYSKVSDESPEREYFVVHTDKEQLDIEERY